ncbi:translesion error-prone DNA polymerase V autoproteolytic subunit [Rhodocytophaga rosea]|uniref:Translesion error-prone DNA polymerase V autoproteolytic subunit n=1 Tax=Rhodocytophaga rosea TaxID=2704465 RepID=A0A6C0GFA5_9BACT|nr:translesion error-prone DNA polymerase V autoproteolytic subunit [Rhodocytophaga rosea]QHT66412.1 translesion error-prone DNA polymerase V autoproteolytic subunit [Rhodocytophaga rosea]
MRISELYDTIGIIENKIQLPLFNYAVSAGFPSPADDYIDIKLDLNEYLIKRPASTFLVRVKGESMTKAGIYDGDLLTVDRSILPGNGKIVIAVINGECTVKRIQYKNDILYLLPENDAYEPIIIKEPTDTVFVWGVVTHVIHPLL